MERIKESVCSFLNYLIEIAFIILGRKQAQWRTGGRENLQSVEPYETSRCPNEGV